MASQAKPVNIRFYYKLYVPKKSRISNSNAEKVDPKNLLVEGKR